MKKTFKWILFSTLILSIGAIIAMLTIYLPQYKTYANYSTSHKQSKYDCFISYDDDSIEVVKNEELGAVPYTFNVRLYNLSDKDQTLTFRFWFTCTDSEGEYYEYVDKEITIPKAPINYDLSKHKYYAGSIDYSCELYEFSHCTDVKFGANVPFGEINISGFSSTDPNSSLIIQKVLINRDGVRKENGFEVTSQLDLCEMLDNNTDLMQGLNNMWQRSFTGVIIALSCTGGVLVLCLAFTIILLLPNKKKKIEG